MRTIQSRIRAKFELVLRLIETKSCFIWPPGYLNDSERWKQEREIVHSKTERADLLITDFSLLIDGFASFVRLLSISIGFYLECESPETLSAQI